MVEIINKKKLKVKFWERGAGLTYHVVREYYLHFMPVIKIIYVKVMQK